MSVKMTQEDFERLVSFMKKNYGINLEKKSVLIEGRLGNMIVQRGFKSFKEYLDFALSDKTGKETIQLVNKLTTNHTFFLREPEHFDYLKKVILPYIEKHNTDHSMNLWCAAASKGHEPYTILFTLLDYFGPSISKWRVNYIATDIDTEVLKYAANGVYPALELKDVPQAWIQKYFTRINAESYKVRDNFRSMIQFKQFNLMDKIDGKVLYDFISCRNVMIYFDQKTKNDLVERFYDVTREGGYLFTGHSESVSRDTRYEYIQPAIYRRNSKMAKPAAARPTVTPPTPVTVSHTAATVGIGAKPATGIGAKPATGIGATHTTGIGAKPATGIGAKPTMGIGAKPTTGIGTKPATGIGAKPSMGIGAKPATGIGAKPTTGIGTKPATGIGAKPATGIGAKPTTGIGAKPATGIGAKPATGIGAKPATGIGAKPATGIGAKPATEIGVKPTTGIGAKPATGIGSNPTTGIGAKPTSGGIGSKNGIGGKK